MGCPAVASQSRAVPSWQPVSTTLPSERNATVLTASGCCIGEPMGWLVVASQSRAVLSLLPVSTALPSGLNATATTHS